MSDARPGSMPPANEASAASSAKSGSGYVADSTLFDATVDALVRNWIWILGLTLLGGVSAFVASFLVKPAYRSDVRVSIVMDVEGAGEAALGGALGGLASLAGIQTRTSSQRAEALAVLASRSLGEEFLIAEELLPGLFSDRWDEVTKTWIVSSSENPPSIREAFKDFSRHVRVIQEDKQTGLVLVGIYWFDRDRAAALANEYVALANATLRDRAIAEAQASLKFLDTELNKTQSIAVRESIYRLVEQQTRKIMFANVRRDYAFKVIDPAVAPDPDDLARPRRLLMTSVGAMLGLAFGVLVGVLRGRR